MIPTAYIFRVASQTGVDGERLASAWAKMLERQREGFIPAFSDARDVAAEFGEDVHDRQALVDLMSRARRMEPEDARAWHDDFITAAPLTGANRATARLLAHWLRQELCDPEVW